uniref:EF-hand domain-containing protein n=1 Tax=Arion vulgaris TaxID=1028688 RepID=A0A0B6YU17_9EUPU
MESKHTKEQLAEYRELFDVIDRNRDGIITVGELEHTMRALGQKPTEEELKKMIDNADLDGNGKIDFQEFTVIMSRQKKYNSKEEELRDVFKVVDSDGNGLITAEELRQIMVNLGEKVTMEEVYEMIRELDMDGNGAIDVDEFVKIMS